MGIFYSQQFAKSQNECAQYQINASCVRKQNNQASFSFADDTHFGSCQAGIDCNDPVISGKSYAQGTEVIFSNIKNPAVGVICSESNTQRRICTNGVFSGDATYTFADADNKDNPIGGCKSSSTSSCNKNHVNTSGGNELISIPNGQSKSFYAFDKQSTGALCEQNKETFTCKEGVLTDSKGIKIVSGNATDLKFKYDGCVDSANYCKYVKEGPGVIEVNPIFKKWKKATSENCDNEVQILACTPENVIPTFSAEYTAIKCNAPGEDRTKPKFIGAIESVKATESQIKISGWACVNKDRKAPASDQVFDLTLWANDNVVVRTNVTKMVVLSSSDLTVRTDKLDSCVNYNLSTGTKAQFEFIINKGSDGIYSKLVGQYVQVWVTDNNIATNILNLDHLSCSATSCVNKGTSFYTFPNYLASTTPTYLGFLESSYVKNGKTYFGGWACEKGNKNPVTVSIYVKTDSGPRQIWTVTANQDRGTNFNNACGSGVATHGFEVEINEEMVQQLPGKEIFAATFISSTNSYSELLINGTRPVIIKIDQKPTGKFDAIGNNRSKLVSGWAYDPYDLNTPVAVHFYQCQNANGCVNFNSGFLGSLKANQTFDVDKNTVAYDHRFDGAISSWMNENIPGDLYICAYAINPKSSGENVLLGCIKSLRSCYYYQDGEEFPHLNEYVSKVDGLTGTASNLTPLRTYCTKVSNGGGSVGSSNYNKCVISHINTFGANEQYCN